MDEQHEEQQGEQHEGIDWDAAFKDMLSGSGEEPVDFIQGELKLYSTSQGFEFHFKGDGGKLWAYPLTDIQAAELALTIMAVIGNRP